MNTDTINAVYRRPLPDNLPTTAEYGSPHAVEYAADYLIHQTTARAMLAGKPRTVELYELTAGYTPAGSAMRLQPHTVYGYRWNDGRAYHGRSFRTMEEARQHFDAITNANA